MKKRLLLITNGYPYGESERGFLTEEVKVLSAQFDLFIMALESKDELRYPTDGILHIEQYRFSSLRQSRQYRSLPSVFQLESFLEAWAYAKANGFSNPIGDLRRVLYARYNVWEMEQQIGRLIEAEKIDIVYTYWGTECSVAAANLKKRFPGLKVVSRFHGVDLYEERTAENWQFFRKELARKADGLGFICLYGRDYFKERWGAKYADKMHVFYLGSSDYGMREHRGTECLRIVSCSNLIPLKRVHMIIEGLVALPETVRVCWDHFGEGVERAKLEALADEKFSGHTNIQWCFHGFVPNVTLPDKYRELMPDLFITTSSTEGLPVSIQEAFSMGIPAIGTNVGGIPDLIVDGHTGYMLPADVRASDVAEAIMRYAAMPEEEKRKMSDVVRRHWEENFNAKENAVRFAEYLKDLASE